jgi:hypothetical protein
MKPLREWVNLAPKASLDLLRKWSRIVPSEREIERLRYRVVVG